MFVLRSEIQIYFADLEQINVMDLDTQIRATVLGKDLFAPVDIILDSRNDQQWMYFTDIGFKHGIFFCTFSKTNQNK